MHTWDPRPAGEVALQFDDVLRECVRGHRIATHCTHGRLIAARGSSEAEVDPAWMQGLQRAELLSDRQWRVVRQHDSAGTEPDRVGLRCNMGDQHARRGRCDGRHVVMLGVPDPAVSAPLGTLRHGDRCVQRLPNGLAFADDRQIEDGQRNVLAR